MIKISIDYKNDLIEKITIKGHSGYSESGSDIVCASVSSIAITSINGILKIDENCLKYMQDDGFLEVDILKHTEVINQLLDNMIELLEELEKQYKEFIKIRRCYLWWD